MTSSYDDACAVMMSKRGSSPSFNATPTLKQKTKKTVKRSA